MDLNDFVCYSNLFNCDTDGALLYAGIAAQHAQQVAEAIAITENSDNNDAQTNQPKQEGGFFKRLFKGKK
ncbi:MAG: hypothetical protein LBL27_03110 [Coriobacteriales bacterium]|nr:hypothetical protein [Coriobacteriales bacterium]